MPGKDALYFKSKASRGFTLLEILVVLSITAIIVAFATPSFMNIMANNRVAAASSELLLTLNMAKNEAIKTGQSTILCKSSDASQCDINTTWNTGWLLFNDLNNDRQVDDGDKIIRTHGTVETSLNFNFYTGNYVRFNSSGQLNENGRFCFNNAYRPENSRAVIITQTGRIRTEVRDSTNNCADT